ncbi:hypothetical protein LTLLF_142770 [Microtus ochrogaster]|uniref:Uncharacterized protein n=1 Tax=Microtus ochrogaster TaxID=79684 RepID=A0A8J6GNB2_MICOH|nr:hypothetical protein LTLLF_142770 [Microtus ochrogaster]
MKPGWQKSVTRAVPLKDVLALLQVLASMKAAPALVPVQSFLVSASGSVEVPYGGLPPVEEGDRKISLIMELSTQLSLQTEKITQLEEVLAEKEQKIEALVAKRSDQLSQEDTNLTEDLQELPVVCDDKSVPVASDEEL